MNEKYDGGWKLIMVCGGAFIPTTSLMIAFSLAGYMLAATVCAVIMTSELLLVLATAIYMFNVPDHIDRMVRRVERRFSRF